MLALQRSAAFRGSEYDSEDYLERLFSARLYVSSHYFTSMDTCSCPIYLYLFLLLLTPKRVLNYASTTYISIKVAMDT